MPTIKRKPRPKVEPKPQADGLAAWGRPLFGPSEPRLRVVNGKDGKPRWYGASYRISGTLDDD